jgi:hypothetical protein
VQWIFLNWGQQFSTWQKSLLAIFNWFMFFGMPSPKQICLVPVQLRLTTTCTASAFLTVFGLYTSISDLSRRVNDPNDPLDVFTCADNSLF